MNLCNAGSADIVELLMQMGVPIPSECLDFPLSSSMVRLFIRAGLYDPYMAEVDQEEEKFYEAIGDIGMPEEITSIIQEYMEGDIGTYRSRRRIQQRQDLNQRMNELRGPVYDSLPDSPIVRTQQQRSRRRRSKTKRRSKARSRR